MVGNDRSRGRDRLPGTVGDHGVITLLTQPQRMHALVKDSRNFDYFRERLETLLRHLRRCGVQFEPVNVFSTFLWSFVRQVLSEKSAVKV